MKRSLKAWLPLVAVSGGVALAAFACGDLEEYYRRGPNGGRFSRHTRGAAIDVSEDDSRVVVVNRDSGSITVFEAKYGVTGADALRQVTEVNKVCNEETSGDRGEPWQVVLDPSGDTAYVVCRSEQVVAEVVGIKSDDPHPSGRRVKVGSEPTGIALTPRATSAWVANWVDGTIQRIDTASMTVAQTVDLNGPLAATYLGGVKARPALAHPRSIAISNDGDDDENDESLLVTEYFSQQKEPLNGSGDNADIARVGILYRVSLSTPVTVKVIELPAGEMGFLDARNDPQKLARCFPNQLQSVTINGNAAVGRVFAYITSVCASPLGPIGIYSPANQPAPCTTNANCLYGSACVEQKCTPNTNGAKTTITPAITVIDLAENKAVDNGTVALNYEYSREFYDAKKFEDDSSRRLPLLANDVAFRPGTFDALVTAGGADALFRLTFDVAYGQNPVKELGPGPFVALELASRDSLPVGPVGVIAAHSHPQAFVANDGERTVARIDLDGGGAGTIIGTATATGLPSDANPDGKSSIGKRLFNFGLSRWSMKQQGWGACAVCHVDGLSDNVTWFFPRGPRQTPSIDGFFDRQKSGVTQRNFGWNAALDEASDLDNNVLRNMFGGVGAIVSDAKSRDDGARIDLAGDRGLSGSSLKAGSVLPDWTNIIEFLKAVRTPKRPTGLDPAAVKRGFEVAKKASCGGCHGGALWTISKLFYEPQRAEADAGPDAALTVNDKLKAQKWDASSLPLGVLPTTDESARTMRYAGTKVGAFDSLTCSLRDVGTFGKTEPGVGIAELRENMKDVAQGSGASGDVTEPKGFNPPSLFGLAVGAPYFHAGNARTLEAALSKDFAAHRGALVGGESFAMSDEERDDLILFLLAIDRSADAEAAPLLDVPAGSVLCAPPQ
jgi:hypothetical protein